MIEFKYQKKTYIYDSKSMSVVQKNDPDQAVTDEPLHYIVNFINSVKSGGFSLRMDYQQFDRYVSVLESEEKEKLFHQVYEAYLYVNHWMNQSSTTQSEFYKGMAKMKRYEQYLYKILES